MLLLASPVLNVCGIVVMSLPGSGQRKNSLRQILRDIFLNPITIALVADLLFALPDLPLPSILSPSPPFQAPPRLSPC